MVPPLLAFAGISAVVIVTPGPDTAVTISGTLSSGRRGGVCTALGVFCGQAIWTLAAGVGVAALLVACAPAFLAVKYAGAAYLAFLGLRALWAALRQGIVNGRVTNNRPKPGLAMPEQERRCRPLACYRRGLLSDLGNPKMALFFTGLLPQFGSRFITLTSLGLLFCAMTFGWLCCYSLAVAKMDGLLRSPRIRAALDAATGTVLVAFSVKLALEQR